MIIVAPWILRILTRGFANALTFWPFILVESQSMRRLEKLIRHERIHLRQQLETGIIVFYFWYLLDYVAGRLEGKSHLKAYESIRFEKEAYQNEGDTNYLKNRRFWAFMDY